MNKRIPIITVLLGIVISSILSVSNVFASSAIDSKYKVKDFLNCYTHRMKKEVIPDQVTRTQDLMLDEWQEYGGWSGKPKDEREPLGGLHTEEGATDEIGCIKLLEELGFAANNSNSGDVLTRLGYEPQTSSGKCITTNFQWYDPDNDKWHDFTGKAKLCASAVDKNGVIQGELLGYSADWNPDGYDLSSGFLINGNEIHFGLGRVDTFLYKDSYSCGFAWMSTCYHYLTYEVGKTKWSDLVSQIDSGMQRGKDTYGPIDMVNYRYQGHNDVAGGTSAVSSYKMKANSIDSFYVGYKNAFGKDYATNALEVTKEEQAVLYQNYLNDYYGIKVEACASTKEDSTKAAKDLGESWVQTKLYQSGGTAQYCYITPTKHQADGVYGVNGAMNTTGLVSDGRLYWKDLATWLLNNGPNSIGSGQVSDPGTGGGGGGSDPGSDDDDTTDEEKLEEACYREAKSLGWIICPIIFGLQEVTTGIYEKVEPMIRVNDSVISQIRSGNSGGGEMFKAWNTFRSIANVLFVILFLFIIFSQLTGIGIDNYGIKKMLPKVIVTAILVNVSFIICALAVDVSNILGKALQDLFSSLAPSAAVLSSSSPVDGTIKTINLAVGAILTLSGGAAVVGAFAMNGWALIIPIFLFLIVMIISIIFALIVLGLRQAFVVILVIVSPIAFACTLLPNTESVFKKWIDFFKQILMVYPIVGGLIGAGYFVARMILTSESDLIMVITAGMLCVAPYFLVPSLTRKSLAAAGNIGERLRGASRAARGMGRNINNSDRVRNLRADSRNGATAFGRRGLDNATMRAAKWAKGEGKGTVRAGILNHTIASKNRLRAVAANNQGRVASSRETLQQAATAAVQHRERMENGGYAARDANLENQALEAAIADQASLWENDGTFNNDAKFQDAVYQAAVSGDAAKLEALMRKATSGSDKQRENLRKGMDRAFASGGVDASTAGRYASHVSSNGVYKNQNRSMHDQATALMNAVGNGNYGTAGSESSDFVNSNFVSKAMSRGKQSAAAAFNYDDGEFNALLAKAQSGSAEERQAIAKFMDQAQYLKANDATGQYNGVKQEALDNIQKIKAAALAGGGFSESDIRFTPDSLKVDHTVPAQTQAAQGASVTAATQTATAVANATRANNGRQALDTYTESVIRRVESGDIKADDGERMIRRAEDHINNKFNNGGGNA